MRIVPACALVSSMVLAACGSSTERPPHDHPVGETSGSDGASEPVLGEGVTAIQVACSEGAPDACNAVDDDCDGKIDEGCGVTTGAMQVSLAWNSGADLDLEVSGPADAARDLEGRGACVESEEHPRLENAAIAGPSATPGRYEIHVRFADACGEEEPTTASVSVSAGGRTFGPYNRTVAPGERATIVTVAVP